MWAVSWWQPVLAPDEIARLEAGLPRLSEWGTALLVPFTARRLRGASVLWLNERWFLERHLDVTDAATRRRACAWLLDEFAYSVPGSADPDDAFSAGEKTFAADRYGGSGMVPHGGSGRAGLSGCFQAKGVGVTPLVGDVRSWTYSHGCMWLEEALREAIYSEIAAAEFPHGAVPVIAVLDAGVSYRLPSGEVGERRAIVVRPAALRPAHLERAPMFGGAAGERQARDTNDTTDVKRVVDAIRAFGAGAADGQTPGRHVTGLIDLFVRVAEQVAFGQVHRLCHGGYLTSNVTLDAELLDFGSFRAVPDWSKAYPLDNMPGFGDELLLLRSAIRSLCFFFRKYRLPGSPELPEALVQQAVAQALARRFDLECLRLWSIDDVADADLRRVVIDAMREYFAEQQRVGVAIQRGWRSVQPWIGDELLSREPRGSGAREALSLEGRLLLRIDDALTAHFGAAGSGRRELAWLTAARLLKPRPGLYRENMQAWLYEALGGQSSTSAPDAGSIADAVRECLTRGRRHWSLVPAGLAVTAQISFGHSSALLCRDVAASRWQLWVEGVRSGERVRLFDRWLPVESLGDFRAASGDTRWAGLFPVRDVGGGLELGVPSGHLALPEMARWHTIIDPDRLRDGPGRSPTPAPA